MTILHTQRCTTTDMYGYQQSVSINCSALPGTFSLRFSAETAAYAMRWTAVKGPLEIAGGRMSLSSNGAELAAVELWAGHFPQASAGQLEIPCTNPGVSFDFTISLETRNKQDEQAVFAARSSASIHHGSPNDVCFQFPRTSRQLWSNEDNLRKLSTYYDSLLSSDFAEGSTSSQAIPSFSSHAEYTYDDSDVETDALKLGWKVKSKKGEKQAQHQKQGQNMERGGVPFKTVTIVDTAYTTYSAVLVWIATSYIRFAPLRSKFKSGNSGDKGDKSDKQARAAELNKTFSRSDSQLPPPVSPKSVYRLAHLLEIPDLLQLALDNFKSQLSPANVAYELYSDVSCSYEAIRDAALDFVVANWKEVSKAEGTREMEQRAYAEELPKAAMGTVMLLSRKLSEKYGGI
ncbi:hypothetical protein JCM1840_003363 [Sporobolomyces johnsonii]